MNARSSLRRTESAASPLRRVLGVGGLAFSCFNCIVGSGIFGLPALAAALLGPAAILAYLVCVVLIALVGLCLAEVGSRVSSAGGLYAYARVPFGPVVGGVAGTLLWCANCVVPTAAVANFLTVTLAQAWPVVGSPLPRVCFLATVFTLLAVVNVRGTRTGARLSMVMAIIKLAPLALLVVAGCFAIRWSNLEWTGVPSVAAVGQGAVLLFFAFMGLEGGLSASGEVMNPARTVPKAIAGTLTLVAALYVGLQLVAQGVLGAELPYTSAPLVAIGTSLFGPWGTRLLLTTTVLSLCGYLAADALCSPRTGYALAERGQLPQALARVHPRFGTPAAAICIYSALCFVVAVSGSFRQLVIIGSSGTLLLYLICCLGLLRLRARNIVQEGEPFHAPGGPLVPLGASAIILWILASLPWTELVAAASLVTVSGVGYALHEWLRRKRGLAAVHGLAPLESSSNV
jgi:basic amino acid/polyamine antiporter, APA family